jgi:cytochrome P450
MRFVQTSQVPIRGPWRIPLLGPTGSLLRFFRDPVRCMRSIHERYGKLATVSDRDASLICAFGSEYNRQILSAPDLFNNAAELPVPIPEGSSLMRLTTFLASMNGEEHRKLRRTMQPLFQKSYLESYRDDVVSVTRGELSRWQVGQTLDLAEAMTELVLCVSFRCLFGLDVSGKSSALAHLARRFAASAMSPKLVLLPYDVPGSPYRAFLKLCDELEARLREIVEKRRAQPEGRRDALSGLLAARGEDGAALSDDRLVGLANELFMAGHDTTACTLTWTLFLLARHPRILSDLLDELDSALRGEAPTLAELEQLPLLDAVVRESMRLLPATPFIFFRRTTKALRVGRYDLPPGANLVISPLITHHLPELFPEPLRFKPNRWSTAKPTPYEYLPFSAGPRTCLGASFSSITVRAILAILLQRFSAELGAGRERVVPRPWHHPVDERRDQGARPHARRAPGSAPAPPRRHRRADRSLMRGASPVSIGGRL